MNFKRHKSVGQGKFDPNMMPIPWVESPFFYEILEKKDITEEEKKLAIEFHKNGYVVLDLELSEEYCNNLFQEIFKDEYKKLDQAKKYEFIQYTNYPRIFEGWKENNTVLELAVNNKIMSTLSMLYGKTPLPFQTINFLKGSKQPMHSDIIHFNSIPEKWISAAWIALEDMDETNGTFTACPGSHKLPTYEYPDIGIKTPDSAEEKDEYAQYEDFIEKLIEVNGFEKKLFIAKRGWVMLTASNILHGGGPITDENRTRFSQATHYYYEGVKRRYCPIFSNRLDGNYADKSMDNKDILGRAKELNL